MNSSSSPTTKKRLGIGVDFGTSNSAAAVFDGEQIYLVQLEDDTVVMPSATYIDRELKITTGQSAIDSYIEAHKVHPNMKSPLIMIEHLQEQIKRESI